MSGLHEFSYSNTTQRRVIYYNIFITSLFFSYLVFDTVFSLKQYFYYHPVMKQIILAAAGGLFFGNLLSRILFSYLNHRIVYIIADLLLMVLAGTFLSRGLAALEYDPLLYIFDFSAYGVPAIIALAGLLCGIKAGYFLKVSCGDFIDEKQGIYLNTILMLLGVVAGTAFSRAINAGQVPETVRTVMGASPALILPSIFYINLPYRAVAQFAREIGKDEPGTPNQTVRNDSLVFTYLNFIYIAVFIFLGYAAAVKFFGNLHDVKTFFITVVSLSLLIGFSAGKLLRRGQLHVYGQIFFPVLFFIFLFLLYMFHRRTGAFYGILMFTPLSLAMGLVLLQTMCSLFEKYNHNKRFLIIDIAIFILPAPVLLALGLLHVTTLIYFMLLYLVSAVSILVPGIHLINTGRQAYKKILFFVFIFAVIPSLIIIHLYFNIRLTSDMFARNMRNFRDLKYVNYDARYIKNRVSAVMNGDVIFRVSDSIIRNMKRAMVPLALYQEDERNILFIDYNYRFFKNPLYGMYKRSICLDPLTDENVDFDGLPVSVKQKYVPDRDDVLSFLKKGGSGFFTVVDVPNLLDQKRNGFIFSEEYYRRITRALSEGGIYVRIFSVPGCPPGTLLKSLKNHQKFFKSNVAYLFSNVLVVMSSNGPDVFRITSSGIDRLKRLIGGNDELNGLFMNEYHLLSHLLSLKIEELFVRVAGNDGAVFTREGFFARDDMNSDYTDKNRRFLGLLGLTGPDASLAGDSYRDLSYNDIIYTLLKKTELAESREQYDEETVNIFELKKYIDYRTDLRDYLSGILSYKEEYYYNAAIRLEKEKRWEEAAALYKAILAINKNNFDANYRMGLLSITIQDLDGAFSYLRQAMELKKDHPKVLYLMGVLLFSRGDIHKAIEYFQIAIQKKEKSASLYQYMGLCYEKLERFNEAEIYYEKALLEDPNDVNIAARIETIHKIREQEKNKWKLPEPKNEFDVEKDEEIPIPINKSAYDIRLNDRENGDDHEK